MCHVVVVIVVWLLWWMAGVLVFVMSTSVYVPVLQYVLALSRCMHVLCVLYRHDAPSVVVWCVVGVVVIVVAVGAAGPELADDLCK